MLDVQFGRVKEEDPWNRAATHVDGILSILTGIAANPLLLQEKQWRLTNLSTSGIRRNLRKLIPVRYKSVRYCRRLSLEHYLFEKGVVHVFSHNPLFV